MLDQKQKDVVRRAAALKALASELTAADRISVPAANEVTEAMRKIQKQRAENAVNELAAVADSILVSSEDTLLSLVTEIKNLKAALADARARKDNFNRARRYLALTGDFAPLAYLIDNTMPFAEVPADFDDDPAEAIEA